MIMQVQSEDFYCRKNVYTVKKTLTSSLLTDTSKSDKKVVEQNENETIKSFVSRTNCLAAEVGWTLIVVRVDCSSNSPDWDKL